jgi:hypothetical protein
MALWIRRRGIKPTLIQINVNRLISSVRYKVERSIGTLKRGIIISHHEIHRLKKGNMEFSSMQWPLICKKAVLDAE